MTRPGTHPSFVSAIVRDRPAQKRVAAVVVAAAAGGLLYGLVAPKWYRSSLTVVPAAPQKSSGISSLLGGELGGLAAGLGVSATGSADVARIAAVLQSAAVADAVIAKFELRSRYDVEHPESAREALGQHCEVRTLQKPGAVQVSCEDHDPKVAQAITAYFAEVGNTAFRRVGASSASEEVRFLERRVVDLRREADEVAGRVREFQEKHQIVDLEGQARAMVSSVAALNSQRIAKRMELEYASKFSSPEEPGVRQLESQLSVVDEQLRDLEIPRDASAGAHDRPPGDRDRGAGMFPAALAVPRLRAEGEKLFRDRRVAEASLVFALDRLEGAKAAEARDVSTLVVLDPATLPTRKSRPVIREMVLAGAALGFALGIAWQWWAWRRRDGAGTVAGAGRGAAAA
jgi:tyrosine-protein kinase Etk/Wzc